MADKTLKSLNFGGADNYFPLPNVSANDNNKILSVVNGEWVVKEAPSGDDTGQYVWSKKDSAGGPVTGYVISNDGEKYPDGGWSHGIFYTLELEPITTYLRFLGNDDFTLKTYNTTKNWDGTLEYSTDTMTWNTWDGTEISSAGSKLYLRGTGNTKITGNSNRYGFVFTGTDALKIACRGNIENLLDYETVRSGGHPTMASNCYAYMFNGCTALTKAPTLPATTLAVYCYGSMFRGCTALTTAPDLPATTLDVECYRNMFYGCTLLTTPPSVLPATTLADSCYYYMFNGCTALTTAPELPATTLTTYCYSNMFNGCTALTKAPTLPATTLTEGCYGGMFNRCTSLTTPPSVLPATTLADYCYQFMFEFTAIDAIPRIMATTYATDSCKGMFDDIKTLNVYSASGTDHTYGWTAPSSASTYCSGMFGSDDGESEWAKLDGSNFPNSGTPTDGTTYYFRTVQIPYLSFLGNEDFTLKTANTTKNWDGTLEYSTDLSTWNTWDGTEISSARHNLYLRGTGNTKITGNSSNYKFVFAGANALKISCEGNIESLLDYKTVKHGGHPTMAVYCYCHMFNGCTALTKAPELPATTLVTNCYSNMFNGCTSLTTAPELPATTVGYECYYDMFYNCTSLTTPPSILPATTLNTSCYKYMFKGCTSLTTAPELPATKLDISCYDSMFSGCISLTTAPALPATTLTNGCYKNMFSGCTKIKLSATQTGEYQTAYRIPKSGTGKTATNALADMFTNTGGTFKGTPSINTTYYLSTSNTVV